MARKQLHAENRLSVLAGFHAVGSALRRNPGGIETLWVDKSRRDPRMASIIELASNQGVLLHRVDRQELDRVGNGLRHQGVVATMRPDGALSAEDLDAFLDSLEGSPLLLILDRVQDPHNLGACLRSAECAGVDAVILPKDGSAPVTDTVRRVAAGAAEQIPLFYVTNLVRTLESLKARGIWVIGTSEHGVATIFESDLSGDAALVMGGEGGGMRRLVTEACDLIVSIPMAGSVSSLNVSVATGVVLFEAGRQRSVSDGVK